MIKPLNIALVGCGHIAKKHFAAISNFPNELHLTGICDTNALALTQYSELFKVDGYDNLEEMLKIANADIVALCTPSGLHASQTILASQYGKHVITEKPMATKWQDALNMVTACDNAGVNLYVVKQLRFSKTIQRLKKALELGRFGRIYHVNCNVYWTRPQSYYDASPWRGTWAFDGGALMNQASHHVDLLQWLFGPVHSVHAFAETFARKIEVEDTAVLNLRWRSGTIGSLNLTMLTYPKNLETSLTIIGEKGTAKLGGLAMDQIEHWECAEGREEVETAEIAIDNHAAFYQNLLHALASHAHAEIHGREGLKSLEIIIAAYQSARDNKTVALPLNF